MFSIDTTKNSERENYKLLIGSIIPRPIAFITSLSKEGVLNGAPFSYFSIVSSNPPMISVAIQRKDGKQKDTARNIIHTKEFVVHIVDEENVHQVNTTAANLPPSESEIALANLTPVDSMRVSTPGVVEAKIRFECTFEQSMVLGEFNSPHSDLIIGRIVMVHVDQNIYEDGRIDPIGLGAVSRLAGSNYAKIGEIFSIERPD